MKKIIVVVIGIGAVLLWRFVIGPSVQVAATNAAGKGWDDAREDLEGQFRAAAAESLSVFDLPQQAIDNMAKCITSKVVDFLNTTDCSYLYAETITSKDEHITAQEACFERVGYASKENQYTFECMKEHFPNDWKHLRGRLVEFFVMSFKQQGVPENHARTVSECVVARSIDMMNRRKCPVVNHAATKAEELVNSMDSCIEDPSVDKEYLAIVEACTAPGKPDASVQGSLPGQ